MRLDPLWTMWGKDEVKMMLGAKFIAEACVLLNLSYQVRYKSLVLFYNFHSDLELVDGCMASILLGSKVEEEMCTVKRIVYVVNYLYTDYCSQARRLTQRQSVGLKEGCIRAETFMLRALEFDVEFEDVYGLATKFFLSSNVPGWRMRRIVSTLNFLLMWPSTHMLSCSAVVSMAVEWSVGENRRLEEMVERHRMFEERKFDLETYEEIPMTRGISTTLLENFAKRHKHN